MIKTFKCNDTEKIFNDFDVKKFRGIAKAARIKLEVLDATVSLKSLRVPPGNRLEQLKGKRKGRYRGSCKVHYMSFRPKGESCYFGATPKISPVGRNDKATFL